MKTSKTNLTFKTRNLLLSSFLISLAGVSLSMWGASWDITSHLLRTPETFFTPSHMMLYTGVGISLIGAIMGLILILAKTQVKGRPFVFGTKIIVIGALTQIIAGPGDFYWHELFGIDGLLSPTHLALALGIIMVSVGVIIGFARIRSEFEKKNKFLESIIPISFGIFWFSIMWLIFFFVLPISQGDTHNFNPNPYVALVLGVVLIPFSFSLIFWSVSKTTNRFGTASIATLVFLLMNITSNIFTSETLLFYLPWFAVPMVCAVFADYIINKKPKSKFLQDHSIKISGAILGSMFFMLSFPMLAMTFLEFYVSSNVLSYDVIHSSSELIVNFWLMTIIPGAVSGMIGMMYIQNKLSHKI